MGDRMDANMTVRIITADVMDGLAQLESESVHCVVTSPPYFGLRDYGTGQWEGGDSDCDHLGEPFRTSANINVNWDGGNDVKNATKRQPFRNECGKCGATRIDKQIGLEPTPDAYVARLVEVFREVRRVLRKDGTCWLNLGDSYAGGGTVGRNDTTPEALSRRAKKYGTGKGNGSLVMSQGSRPRVLSLKPKDLIGIPWRVAFALQADGWWLRQDIIWSKPNPMPESVTDRCTKAHEYIFLLTKAERYFYDAQAIIEEGSGRTPGNKTYKYDGVVGHETKQGILAQSNIPQLTRNKRSVWEVTAQPFPEAHFATFPPALIEPCIKAGTSEAGCCAACGEPLTRDVERTAMVIDRSTRTHSKGQTRSSGKMVAPPTSKTVGWSLNCGCTTPADIVPCRVLDPFGGSGTTGLVADRLKRNAILIELNPEYAAMAERRVKGDSPLFAEVSA